MLQSLTGPGSWIDTNDREYSFTPSAPLTLTSGTTYWLVLRYTGAFAFTWNQNNPQADPIGPEAEYFGQHFANPFPTWGVSELASERPSMQINGTLVGAAVPEPSGLLVPGLGLLVRVRKRRA